MGTRAGGFGRPDRKVWRRDTLEGGLVSAKSYKSLVTDSWTFPMEGSEALSSVTSEVTGGLTITSASVSGSKLTWSAEFLGSVTFLVVTSTGGKIEKKFRYRGTDRRSESDY